VIKDNHNPVWQERFEFEQLTFDEIRHDRVIEVTVWDCRKQSKHYDFIGGLRLGPLPKHGSNQPDFMDSSEGESSHWMTVVDTPGDRVMQLHSLRHTMSPRPITTTQPTKDELTTYTVGVSSQEKVASPHDVIMQQEAMVQQEVVTQVEVQQEMAYPPQPLSPPPAIAISTEFTSSVSRSEKMKFDDEQDGSPLHRPAVSCV